jgi:serine/threonine-protein kinase
MLNQILGDYELQQEAGRGPAATVYVARQHPVERFVAVKVFEPQPREVAQRLKELYARLSELDHTHILPLYDSGRWQDRYFWVMRYMPAGSLKTRLSKQRLTLEEIDRVLPQIASALDYAHGRDLVHGDLKLTDILIDHAGQAFVADFGVSTALARSASAFLAPELRHAHAPDIRTDVYGLGAILYELLALRPPFDARLPEEERANRRLVPPAPSTVQSKIPAALDAVVLKALAVDPDQRYQTASDLVDAYVQARLGKKAASAAAVAAVAAASSASRVRRISTRRAEPGKKNRWRLAGLLIGGMFGLLCIAVLIGLLAPRSAAPPPQTINTPAPTATTLAATRAPLLATTSTLAPSSTLTVPPATRTATREAAATATSAVRPTATTLPTVTASPTGAPTAAPTRFVPTPTPAFSITPLELAFPRSEGRDSLSLTFRTLVLPANAGIIGTLSMAVPGMEGRVLDQILAQVGSGDQVLRVAVSINCAGAAEPITSRQIVLTIRAANGTVLFTQPVDYVKRWCE